METEFSQILKSFWCFFQITGHAKSYDCSTHSFCRQPASVSSVAPSGSPDSSTIFALWYFKLVFFSSGDPSVTDESKKTIEIGIIKVYIYPFNVLKCLGVSLEEKFQTH